VNHLADPGESALELGSQHCPAVSFATGSIAPWSRAPAEEARETGERNWHSCCKLRRMAVPLPDVRQVVHEHRTWVEVLARAGYATRGFLYLLIGGLAALAAFGFGGETTDTKGALLELYSQPFGEVLLGLAGAGLAAYAVFSVCRAALDPEREARETWGPLKRAWWGVIALLHASLAVYALSMVLGSDSAPHGGRDETRGLTAALLAWRPLGPWLVASIGVGVLIGSIYQLRCAWRAKLDEYLDFSRLPAAGTRWLVRLSRVGIAARACVGLVAGGFLLVAAFTSNANQAKGFADSLSALRAMPFGGWLFAAVALGLVAFGCYQLIEARYRRIMGRAH